MLTINNDTTAKIDMLSVDKEKETVRLRAVLAVGRKLTRILDLDQLLAESVRLIQDTFGYELVKICLRDQHDPNYFFDSHFVNKVGNDFVSGRNGELIHINRGMVGWVFRNEQHRLANDVSQDPYYYYCSADPAWHCTGLADEWPGLEIEGQNSYSNVKAELDLPLKINGQVIGVLDLESTELNAFDREDVPFLQILADQLAIAVENARLTARAREAAIAEERNRLARNLHDDTVQALIGVTRQLDLLRCDLGDEFSDQNTAGSGEEIKLPPVIERRLDRLQDSLDRTIQGLRLLSRELQPQLLRDLGLAAALDALASDVSRTSNLKVEVELKDSIERLSTDQELEVYRIAQEAVANVVKHASASHIHLLLDIEDDKVLLNITDDGKGFEVPQDLTRLAVRGGMGVLSMRQRACRVGGSLTIQSQLGQGTALTLEMPTGPHEDKDKRI